MPKTAKSGYSDLVIGRNKPATTHQAEPENPARRWVDALIAAHGEDPEAIAGALAANPEIDTPDLFVELHVRLGNALVARVLAARPDAEEAVDASGPMDIDEELAGPMTLAETIAEGAAEAMGHRHGGEGVWGKTAEGEWLRAPDDQVAPAKPEMATIGSEYVGEKTQEHFRDADTEIEEAAAARGVSVEAMAELAGQQGVSYKGMTSVNGVGMTVRTHQVPETKLDSDLKVEASDGQLTSGASKARGLGLDTTGARPGLLDATGDRMIFVMNQAGRITVADPTAFERDAQKDLVADTQTLKNRVDRGEDAGTVHREMDLHKEYFQHSSMVSPKADGSPDQVAAAGDLEVRQGWLRHLSNNSGHFRPGMSQTLQVLEQLSDMGVELGTAKVDFRDAVGLDKNTDGRGYSAGEFLESGGNRTLLKHRGTMRDELTAKLAATRAGLDKEADERAIDVRATTNHKAALPKALTATPRRAALPKGLGAARGPKHGKKKSKRK